MTERETDRRHKAFAVVLSGGGGRGLAHAGVLRALIHDGYRPAALVGVSMGAWVAATYALNDDWYRALVQMDTTRFPTVPRTHRPSLRARVRAGAAAVRLGLDMVTGWGTGSRFLAADWGLLARLTRGGRLEDGRVPVAAIATDLCSSRRAVLTSGRADEAIYASSALAGYLPPLERDGAQLADGGYIDLAPVDVARALGVEAVLAVDPDQPGPVGRLRNGLEATMRAVDICNREHTRLRLEAADLVLRPRFPERIETLDFNHKRVCAAAGIRAVRSARDALRRILPDPAMN